ncbi:hypothetical protein CANCADRAFT_2114 [Tortispora caseinolytica NRRL Y-17796]|uniref:Prefoldin subunit 2 n=1 Tax=Tortispora caseinolytica NRRL Y-17796 TaxID=767744 RepID=A0A1E4TFA5_9ASCO|nr:hypothetical protein CANCADRAFT_2114 [Tortispora caseinolytica NRRL Y-17796]
MADDRRPPPADLQRQYDEFKSKLEQINLKISELDAESADHAVVIKTLTAVPPDRKAYRLIGGILTEGTVETVLPAVKANKEGIEKVIVQLKSELSRAEKDLASWQAKHKVQIVRDPTAAM